MKINYKFNALLISTMAACVLSTATAATAADAAKSETVFTEAMAQYKQGKWSGAYGRFAALADKGHAEAARIALIMLRHGSTMYGSDWGASQPQVDRWTKLALQRAEPIQIVSGD